METKWFFIFCSAFGVCFASTKTVGIDETMNTCVTVAVPEEELIQVRELSAILASFLMKNMQAGHEHLQNIIEEELPESGREKLEQDAESSLHAVILRYIIKFYRDIKTDLGGIGAELRSIKKIIDEKITVGEITERINELKEEIFNRINKESLSEIKDGVESVKKSIASQLSANETQKKLETLEKSIQNSTETFGITTEEKIAQQLAPQKDALSEIRKEILDLKEKLSQKYDTEINKLVRQIEEAVPFDQQIKEIKDLIRKTISEKDNDEASLSKKEIETMWKMISEKRHPPSGHLVPEETIQKPILTTWESEFITDPTYYFDCCEILKNGYTKNGVYQIYPGSADEAPVSTFCDMETTGGGWTVLLARKKQEDRVNFRQDWNAYKRGFGSAVGEFWLGNENLHLLTSQRNYTLRLEIQNLNQDQIWAEWDVFKVGAEDSQYKLSVQKYNLSSIMHDTLVYHDGSSFSTIDRDNDEGDRHCAFLSGGGWWYRNCYTLNPTGVHDREGLQGMSFYSWFEGNLFVNDAEMLQLKIRTKACE